MEPAPRNPRSKVEWPISGGQRTKQGSRTAPLTGREIRRVVGSVIPVYRRMHGAASCGLGDSVAEIGVNGASCYIGASNSIPVLLPPLQDNRSFGTCRSAIGEIGPRWTVPALEVALCQSEPSGTNGGRSPESGPVGHSVSVLVHGRPERSPGPGRLTTQVGACDHPGQDAKPAPHRLPLLCGVCWRSPPRRSPAIDRWVLSVGASHPVPSAFESFPGQGVVHDGPGVRRPV